MRPRVPTAAHRAAVQSSSARPAPATRLRVRFRIVLVSAGAARVHGELPAQATSCLPFRFLGRPAPRINVHAYIQTYGRKQVTL
uniref:Uncharacterized protein n=1 Tax=Rangifer tarandus platyrhynchus TaxID=3082113 RepID=A0ACB0FB46_RANTA|nr:unnamed protein product [Rangifer tarandus platyrhynchus]